MARLERYTARELAEYMSYNGFIPTVREEEGFKNDDGELVGALQARLENVNVDGAVMRRALLEDDERKLREKMKEILGVETTTNKKVEEIAKEMRRDFEDCRGDDENNEQNATTTQRRRRGPETVGSQIFEEVRDPDHPSWYDDSPNNDRWRNYCGGHVDEDQLLTQRERAVGEREAKVLEREGMSRKGGKA